MTAQRLMNRARLGTASPFAGRWDSRGHRTKGTFVRRGFLAAVAVVAMAAPVVGVAGGQVAADVATGGTGTGSTYTTGRYIITFADDPVASYDGYATGFPATRPRAGRNINPDSRAVVSWRQHLVAKHDAALAAVDATKIYDYTVANNGVVARLTGKQATHMGDRHGRRRQPSGHQAELRLHQEPQLHNGHPTHRRGVRERP